MNDLDKGAADLTNPTVLEALEIAKVEWITRLGLPERLCVKDKKLCIYAKTNIFGWVSTKMQVTPVDLDHALKEWPRWLTRQFRQVGFERVSVKIAFRDKDWGENRGVCDVTGFRRDGGCVMLATAEGWSPLLAVAQAVLKVGKPKENEDG